MGVRYVGVPLYVHLSIGPQPTPSKMHVTLLEIPCENFLVKNKLRGRSHDTGKTFIPERVHSIPIYFSVSVYMIPSRNLVPAQV